MLSFELLISYIYIMFYIFSAWRLKLIIKFNNIDSFRTSQTKKNVIIKKKF